MIGVCLTWENELVRISIARNSQFMPECQIIGFLIASKPGFVARNPSFFGGYKMDDIFILFEALELKNRKPSLNHLSHIRKF